jgi:hypothetical protein
MIKRIGFLLVALSLTAAQLSAQSFQLGIKGGGNLSDLFSTGNANGTSFSAQAGWNAGTFVNFWLGNHFAIAPELLYTTNGAGIKETTTDNGGAIDVNSNLHLRYVSLPVMAKVRFTGGFYLEAGPEVSVNVSSSTWEDQSVRNFTNNAELGAAAGLGYQSPIGLGVSLRYNVGLTTVNHTSEAAWSDVDLRNSTFSLDLFWTLFNNRRLAENW